MNKRVSILGNIKFPEDSESKERIKKILSGDQIPNSLTITIDAAHTDIVNKNRRMYLSTNASKNAKTYTKPHFKPVLLWHNQDAHNIGRVISSEFVKNEVNNDAPYTGIIKTKVLINDKDAIVKILSGNLQSVSAGFSITSTPKCSICGKDIDDNDCGHYPGMKYEGKECYLLVKDWEYNELSFVNVPADKYAMVTEIEALDKYDDDISYNKFSKVSNIEFIDCSIDSESIESDAGKINDENTETKAPEKEIKMSIDKNVEDSILMVHKELKDDYVRVTKECETLRAKCDEVEKALSTKDAEIVDYKNKVALVEADSLKLKEEKEKFEKILKDEAIDEIVKCSIKLDHYVDDTIKENFAKMNIDALIITKNNLLLSLSKKELKTGTVTETKDEEETKNVDASDNDVKDEVDNDSKFTPEAKKKLGLV